MEPGAEVDPEQQPHLMQALDRARRLHEVLQSHEADLLRHAESAEKSAGENASIMAAPLSTEPDATVLRDGAHRMTRAANAAERLIEGLTRALRGEEER
jgi:hypothetical protein